MSKFVNKDSLAQSVSTQLNLSKADGLKAVNIIFDEMSEALQDDGNVDITSFGKFEIFHRKDPCFEIAKVSSVTNIKE